MNKRSDCQPDAKRKRDSAQPQDAKRKRDSAQPQDAKRKRDSAQPQDAQRNRDSAQPQDTVQPVKESRSMIITNKTIHRRAFLRGAGASLALPLLDSMFPALANAQNRLKPATRLGTVYVPNGVIMD